MRHINECSHKRLKHQCLCNRARRRGRPNQAALRIQAVAACVIGIRVTQDRPMHKPATPPWLIYVAQGDEGIDFNRLASEIRTDSIHQLADASAVCSWISR